RRHTRSKRDWSSDVCSSDLFRMTEPEIQGLLQANAGKSEWLPDPDENLDNFVYWSKDKRTRLAIYTLAAHGLMITSKKFFPQFRSEERRVGKECKIKCCRYT